MLLKLFYIVCGELSQWKPVINYPITFMHLADGFTQSVLHSKYKSLFLNSVGIEPMNLALLATWNVFIFLLACPKRTCIERKNVLRAQNYFFRCKNKHITHVRGCMQGFCCNALRVLQWDYSPHALQLPNYLMTIHHIRVSSYPSLYS